jgi:hypothetical protein
MVGLIRMVSLWATVSFGAILHPSSGLLLLNLLQLVLLPLQLLQLSLNELILLIDFSRIHIHRVHHHSKGHSSEWHTPHWIWHELLLFLKLGGAVTAHAKTEVWFIAQEELVII